MKFYAEILHPHDNRVLWHYYLEATDKETAEAAVNKQVVAEHSNGFLLETGGLYLLVVEEEKDAPKT
jgi:hypothetical protein